MSQSVAKPHNVRVYGIADRQGHKVLAILEDREFPSKGAAEAHASEMRKIEWVTSACVYPTPKETAAA